MKAPLPPDEVQRLATLRAYNVLDTPPELAFDDLVLLASQICQTPIAVISLVDENRQWFKAKVGLNVTETTRDVAFCAHAILNSHEVMEVRDVSTDRRFVDNPFVIADPQIRFYAGAPLVAPNGQALGTLCVLDRAPYQLSADQLAALQALSRQVVAQLELGRRNRTLNVENTKVIRSEQLLHEQFDRLSTSKSEGDRQLALGERSRHALLSVIEDEKRAGQNLRRSEERFRQLAENINEVFWITDPSKNEILYVSPACEKIWGRSSESLYSAPQSWFDAIHPEDRERVRNAARQQQVSGDYDEVYRVVRPDNEMRWVHDRAFPIRNAQGEVYRIVGTAEDITERRKLEEQFRQSQKMEGIGQLASGVAHDFNNILASIQMQAELMKFGENLSGEQMEQIEEIKASVERAAALTRQLLLFSRKEIMRQQDFDLNQSIENMTKMLHRIIGEDIKLEFQRTPEPLYVHADAGMLDQVLMNLVVNARDAMSQGGRLVIATAAVEFDDLAAAQSVQVRPGAFVCLSVSDNGVGIPPENLSRIFEPFFTTKEIGKGTGLGLATVFGIVQQHQGWVNVASQVGHGTTFQIYLPRLLTEASGQKAASQALTMPRGGQETILLLEDDKMLGSSVRKILTRLGYRVLPAFNGLEALAVWKSNRHEIRLLLTDLVMPGGINGKELAEQLLRENPKLKVIYASGYSAEILGKDFPLEEGVNFLTKPFLTIELARAVRAALDA